MAHAHRTFVPAAGHDWLLPIYDPLQKLLGGDSARPVLVEQASLAPGQRALDIGCGTGSLILLIRRLHPGVDVFGIDPDPKALARARRKLLRSGLAAHLDRGFSDALPYPDASYDRVFSSFMLHHLTREEKLRTLRESLRVLRPGGGLHILDFGQTAPHRDGFLARAMHAGERMRDNAEGRIPTLMAEAGFLAARELAHRTTLFGRIAYYASSAPGAGPETA